MGNPKIRDVRNESILSKTKKSMRMGNFFLPKYDFFSIDRGWYNSTYYGEVCVFAAAGGRSSGLLFK